MNDSWKIHKLVPDIQVTCCRAMPALPDETEELVEASWRKAQSAHKTLFNGRVFSADTITPRRILGHWTEYRRVLAQMRNPALFDALQLRSLAVVGVLHTNAGVVIGRRTRKSVYQAGLWQTPPAGSVESRDGEDIVDLGAQILAEADEELGLPPGSTHVGAAIAAVEHPGSHIIDIGLKLYTDLAFDDIHQGWKARANQEYEELALLPLAERLDWCKGADVLEPTRIFLAGARALPD